MSFPLLTSICESALRGYSRIAPTERGGYRLARLVRRARARKHWRDTFLTPDGVSLDLDLAIYPDVCMAYGLYELTTARLLERLLKTGDHFVDGGANIGYFTLLAARHVGATGRVDAFEPQPQNRARLEENLRRNGLADRVRVHPTALSDRSGEVDIYTAGSEIDNHGTSSMFRDPAWQSSVTSTRVRAARMDEVLADTQPKLVKLDVEGAEPLAASGMRGLLASPETAPSIIIEFNRLKAAASGFEPGEAISRLLAMRPEYQLFTIGWRVKRVTISDLMLTEQVNLLLTMLPR